MNIKNIILVLGAPNDEFGNLSTIAVDRLTKAYNLYLEKGGFLLCTGGFGEHFNVAELPHAQYAKQFLLNLGVPNSDFLEIVLTSNTVDDFRKTKEIITSISPKRLFVVTSDFHIERSRIICDIVINYPYVDFISARSSLSEEELLPLIIHEKNAIERIKENNFILY